MLGRMGTVLIYPYRWRVRTRLPERFGRMCRVLVRSKRMNSALVEFEDGFKVVTSRNYLRKVESMSETIESIKAENAELKRKLERQKKANALLLTDATAKKVFELQNQNAAIIAEATSLRDTLSVVDRNLSEMTTERNKLVKKLDDWGQTYQDIIADKTCLTDEYHCGCVPALREELGKIKAENEQLKVEYSKSLNNLGYEIAGLKAENDQLKQPQREQAGWRRPDVEEPQTWSCPECGAEDWPKYRVSCACGYRRPSRRL